MIDAAAAASVAALHGHASVVVAEDITVVCSRLEERRANLAAQRVRSVNQFHALGRDLIPGGAPTPLKANTAGTLLRKIRPKTPPEATRKTLAWSLVREIRSIDIPTLRAMSSRRGLPGESVSWLFTAVCSGLPFRWRARGGGGGVPGTSLAQAAGPSTRS